MKLDFFCVAEDIQLGTGDNPIVHNQFDTIAASEFPFTVREVMCCIVTGAVDERPVFLDLRFVLENEAGEFQSGFSISVRSMHGYDANNPQPLRSVHILPAGQLIFKAPGRYTARITLEGSNSLEQTIVVTG